MKLSPAVRDLITVIRRHRLTYDSFRAAAHTARKHCSLTPSNTRRRLPHLLPEATLHKFFHTVDTSDNLQHQILLRLLFYTGVRVSELIKIRIADIDLGSSKIFIERGKGDKDRYILFPDSFRLTLRAYIESHPEHEYLFESTHKKHYTRQRIGQIVREYQHAAGIEERIHPHLFRHQFLTWLTKQGLSDQQIQLISGHSSRESLEVYQHLSLSDVASGYQDAMRKVEV